MRHNSTVAHRSVEGKLNSKKGDFSSMSPYFNKLNLNLDRMCNKVKPAWFYNPASSSVHSFNESLLERNKREK